MSSSTRWRLCFRQWTFLRVIVAEAATLAAWDLANTQRLKTIQADTVPAPVLSVYSLPSSSTALAIPTLRPGVWAEQILKFETQWNPPREFPVKVLLGSEAILARLLHEATVSRLFTPVSLGEILRNWAYSSSGLVNPLAMKRADVVGHQIIVCCCLVGTLLAFAGW